MSKPTKIHAVVECKEHGKQSEVFTKKTKKVKW